MSKWVLDYSLSLVNRTAAFYLSRDLKNAFSDDWRAVRRWRSHNPRDYSKYERKIRAKCMLAELSKPSLGKCLGSWNRIAGASYLHMDPLYCRNDALTSRDRVLCHDIGPISHPELYGADCRDVYSSAYRRIQDTRPQMTFVSQASKSAFTKYFGDDYPSMDVVPLYLRESLLESIPDAKHLSKPPMMANVGSSFFISIGEVGSRKGLLQSVQGYARSELHKEGVEYVICGPSGAGYEAVAAIAKKTPGLHLFGYITDEVMPWLYHNALGFVLLSRLEGFGIPAIEAPFFGLLPLISHDPALVEVTGGHAFRCEPSSVDEVAQSLRALASLDPIERNERIKLICEHARSYTFENFMMGWAKVLGLEAKHFFDHGVYQQN